MPVSFAPAAVEYLRFLPEIVLIVAGTLLMVLDVLLRKQAREIYGHISIVALLAAMAAAVHGPTPRRARPSPAC
jgi:NADH:ubiquinone oxidoreductase subunit 2 (subunit N)